MTVPVPGTSKAILLGAHEYARLNPLTAVRANLESLHAHVLEDEVWRLREEDCLFLSQPEAGVSAITDNLYETTAQATGTLLVYYAGHGTGDPDHADRLMLALPGSHYDRPWTWLDYAHLRRAVQDSPAARKLVVLDCCYGGKAIDGGMSGDSSPSPTATSLIDLADMDGTCVLTAASGEERAMCPPDAEYSAFTGELLRLLRQGATGPIPSDPHGRHGEQLEVLDISTLYAYLRDRLSARSVAGFPLPEPQLGTRNNGGGIVVGRNRSYVPPAPPPGTSAPDAPVTPMSLTAPDAVHVGRGSELRQILDLAERIRPGEGRPASCLVHGMGGSGKTHLLRMAAAELRERFPDAAFEIDLHGFAAARSAAYDSSTEGIRQPAEALESLLSQVGHPKIPPGLQARQEEWRAWLAGRRALLLLDNAHDAKQVAPLLPGQGAECLALISSRSRDFPSDIRIGLGELPEKLAVDLLTTMAQAERPEGPVSASPADLVEIARRCGHLPVALRPIGAALATLSAAAILDATGGPEPFRELPSAESAVRLAFESSYNRLPDDLKETLWACAWHPGRTYSAPTIGVMLDISPSYAELRLDRLTRLHLLQGSHTRPDLHDLYLPLVRAAAREVPGRREARARLYRQLADLTTAAWKIVTEEASGDRFDSPASAREWLVESTTDLEAAAIAALADRWPDAHGFAEATARWLRFNSQYDTAAMVYVASLELARTTNNRLAQANALQGLGDCHRLQDRYDEAAEHYQRALELARTTTNRTTQAYALIGLAHCHRPQDRYDQATEHYQQALELARSTGNRTTQAYALIGLAHCHRLQNRYEQTAEHYQQALELARETGNHATQASALVGLADCDRLQGDYDHAIDHYQQAFDVARLTGNNHATQTNALIGLADCHRTENRYDQAAARYRQAFDLARTINNRTTQAMALIGLAHCDRVQDHHPEAIKHYRQSLELARATNDRLIQAYALNGLADSHRAQGRYDHATAHYRDALDLSHATNNRTMQALALTGLAECHTAQDQRRPARKYLRRAIRIYTDIGRDDRAELLQERLRELK
ncbi:hypothetical protein SRB5_12320 [Streptomyces sp. RB5]|uniref:AAA+ ATPase domain-containing protein n=1 Tax=Streptomyces smaragdinus TaxID=2585196 RepID=A0A7K0CCE5_9ACTN|nr:tetratricopeptide repeat protein [Streptomyces smaragdinus]MQY11118.1 hypothetical protein [Streptomyces smaragdinus]